jgi:Phytanoyl-CoA dioxygenase (PhyH)
MFGLQRVRERFQQEWREREPLLRWHKDRLERRVALRDLWRAPQGRAAEAATSLARDGFARIEGAFDPAALAPLRAQLEELCDAGQHLKRVSLDSTRELGDKQPAKVFIEPEELARGQSWFRDHTNYVMVQDPLVRCPAAIPLAFDELVGDIAAAYLGAPAAVGGCNVRKSFANGLPPFDTLYYHSDPNSPRMVKFFFYLNDVDEAGGPFTYVLGSHKAKFPGWRDKYRWTHQEMIERFGAERILPLTGKVGDLLMADTTGFHRGAKAEARDRRILIANYVIHPEFEGRQAPGAFHIPLSALSGLSPRQRRAADFLQVTVDPACPSAPAPEGREIGGLEAGRIYASEISGSLKTLVRSRVRRDSEAVAAEYDGANWSRVLEGRSWERCPDVRSYVAAPGDARPRKVLLERKLTEVPNSVYRAYRLEILTEVLTRYCGDGSELLELGCGWGLNLFSLSLAERWTRLRGFDISPNAIQALACAAEQFGLSQQISADLLDLTDPASPHWAELEGQAVFSYFCLEQLPHHTEQVLRNILAARPRRVVHLETSYELLEPWRAADLATLLYVQRMDYQRSLLSTLRDMEARGEVRVLATERLGFAPKPCNDPTLVCWEPV